MLWVYFESERNPFSGNLGNEVDSINVVRYWKILEKVKKFAARANSFECSRHFEIGKDQ